MSQLREAFDAVKAMALAAQSSYRKISVGAMPGDNSLCMAISSGGDHDMALSSGRATTLDVVVNACHARQETALDALACIHHTLTRTEDLPRGNGWQVTSMKTNGAPGYLDYNGKQWLYGSALEITIYFD